MSNIIGGTIVWNLDIDEKDFSRRMDGIKNEANNAAESIDGAFKKSARGIVSSFDSALSASKAFAGSLAAIGTTLIAGGGVWNKSSW